MAPCTTTHFSHGRVYQIWQTVIRFVSISATAARLSSGSLADFLARKDLADFLLEAFARLSRRWFCVFGEKYLYKYNQLANLHRRGWV
jgi:hypothetical protein